MPYLPSDAEKKSQLYSNMINGDTLEYQSEINDLKNIVLLSKSHSFGLAARRSLLALLAFRCPQQLQYKEQQQQRQRQEQ